MKIKVTVGTDIAGSRVSRTFEEDDETWNEMSEEEKDLVAQEVLWELIEWNWEEL